MTKEEQVLKILLEFYPEHIANKKLKIHLNENSHGFTIGKLLVKHGFDEAKKRFSSFREKKSKGNTLEGYIERYGEEQGLIKYKEKNSRLSVSEASLRKNGKTDEEIKQIRDRHSNKSKRTEEMYVSSYGEETGKALYAEYDSKRRERSPRCVEYFLAKGYDENEAIKKVSDFQRIDLDYWLSTGRDKESYERMCYEKTKRHKREYYIETYGETEGEIKFKEAVSKRMGNTKLESKPQLEFSKKLFESLPESIKPLFRGQPFTDSKIITFDENEWGMIFSIPDVVIENIIIEFDGVYWHSRPEIKERDEIKDILRTQMGYHTIRVTDASWKKEPNLIIEHLVDTIKNTIKLREFNENKDD